MNNYIHSTSKCFFIKVCILIEEGDVSDWLHLQEQKSIRVSFYCIFLKKRVNWSYQSKILAQKLAKLTENKAIPNLRCSKYLQAGKINRKSMVDFFLWSSFSTSVWQKMTSKNVSQAKQHEKRILLSFPFPARLVNVDEFSTISASYETTSPYCMFYETLLQLVLYLFLPKKSGIMCNKDLWRSTLLADMTTDMLGDT